MITIPKTDIFSEIDDHFLNMQHAYLEVSSAYNSYPEKFLQLKLSWPDSKIETIRSQITDISLFKEAEFADEIKFNIINNFPGAIDYFKLIIAKQHHFVKSHFPEALDIYLNDNEQAVNLLIAMDTDCASISDENMVKAVQYSYIELCIMIERDFYLQYPFYSPLFSIALDYKRELPKISRILLDYGDQNDAIIKELHEFLNETYIEKMQLEDFKLHFTKSGNFSKIIWKDTDVVLQLLFQGKKLPPEYCIEDFIVLKVKGDPLSIICNHFEKRTRKNTLESFDRLKLSRNSDNLKKPSLNRGSGPMVDFIKNLNRKYAPNNLPLPTGIINLKKNKE